MRTVREVLQLKSHIDSTFDLHGNGLSISEDTVLILG
jgi:hypothetical protein